MPLSGTTRQRLVLSIIPLSIGMIILGLILFAVAQSKPGANPLPESEARKVVAEIRAHRSDWSTIESRLSRALGALGLFRVMVPNEAGNTAKLRDMQFEYFPKAYGDFMYVEFELAAEYEDALEAMLVTAQKHFDFYSSLANETKALRFEGDVSERIEDWRSANLDPVWFEDILLFEENLHAAHVSELRKQEQAEE